MVATNPGAIFAWNQSCTWLHSNWGVQNVSIIKKCPIDPIKINWLINQIIFLFTECTIVWWTLAMCQKYHRESTKPRKLQDKSRADRLIVQPMRDPTAIDLTFRSSLRFPMRTLIYLPSKRLTWMESNQTKHVFLYTLCTKTERQAAKNIYIHSALI